MAFLWFVVGVNVPAGVSEQWREEGGVAEMSVDEKVMLALYCVSCIPLSMILSGWLLYMHVPCVIVRERVEQMTAAVRAMKGHGRDYDAVMSMVQAAHESTLRLSALVTPTMAVNGGISWTVAAVLLLCGVLPRPYCDSIQIEAPLGCKDPTVAAGSNVSPWAPGVPHGGWKVNSFFDKIPPWVCYCAAIIFYLNAFIPLLSAATTSAAADELVNAVGEMRYEQLGDSSSNSSASSPDDDEEEGAQAASAEAATATAATARVKVLQSRPDNLIRIDGLQQYSAELNNVQGIGFTFFKKRIEKRWVAATACRGLCLIILLACAGTALQKPSTLKLVGLQFLAATATNATDKTASG
jgi:hypothetical protein